MVSPLAQPRPSLRASQLTVVMVPVLEVRAGLCPRGRWSVGLGLAALRGIVGGHAHGGADDVHTKGAAPGIVLAAAPAHAPVGLLTEVLGGEVL